jgi:leucyl-tRNA synthetase
VLAPEHSLVSTITIPAYQEAVADYREASKRKSDLDRKIDQQEKTGVFTGSYALHPLTDQPVPIWVADYVLMDVGSGAVMGVPGHDTRDFAFAQQFDLPIQTVVTSLDSSQTKDDVFTGQGKLINSAHYSGMDSETAAQQIVADLAKTQQGKPAISYKLRDWLISRQRYWGAPIPMVHCDACGTVPVPIEQLPIELPDNIDFSPTNNGRSPLARDAEWVNTICPNCSGPAQRETDTMDGFACSSWYFLRFTSPHEDKRPFDPEAVKQWLPVNTYVGGAEHAVMHLLYARFWTKVFFDAGLVAFNEPFTQLRNQGMMLSGKDGLKMSKSKGNVVTPDEVIEQVGTDALRAFLLFLGPFDQETIWNEEGIRGVTRFLDRVWRLVTGTIPTQSQGVLPLPSDVPDQAFERRRHQHIQRITSEMEQFRFNTAVAGLMEYVNYLLEQQNNAIYPPQWSNALETLLVTMTPICPFITEELWQMVLQRDGSIQAQQWPTFDERLVHEVRNEIVIQVNGKVRDKITVAANVADEVLQETAVQLPNIQKFIANKSVNNVIIVQGKLVNIVVS